MDSKTQVVLDVLQAVQDRDADKLADLWHDDVELHDASSLPTGAAT